MIAYYVIKYVKVRNVEPVKNLCGDKTFKNKDYSKAKQRKNKIIQIFRFYVSNVKDSILIESRHEQSAENVKCVYVTVLMDLI